MRNKTKINIIYTVIWSVGLLFVSFLSLFKGENIFDFTKKTLPEFGEHYMFPFIMALCLFLIDVTYNVINQKIWAFPIFSCIVAFMLTIGITVAFLQCFCIVFICSIIGWTILTFMKYISLQMSEDTYRMEPSEIVEDK